jgi:hypothetical protein
MRAYLGRSLGDPSWPNFFNDWSGSSVGQDEGRAFLAEDLDFGCAWWREVTQLCDRHAFWGLAQEITLGD